MEHLSNDHKDSPNQHKNIQKLCDETGEGGGEEGDGYLVFGVGILF